MCVCTSSYFLCVSIVYFLCVFTSVYLLTTYPYHVTQSTLEWTAQGTNVIYICVCVYMYVCVCVSVCVCALAYSSICSVGVFIDIYSDDLPIPRVAEHLENGQHGEMVRNELLLGGFRYVNESCHTCVHQFIIVLCVYISMFSDYLRTSFNLWASKKKLVRNELLLEGFRCVNESCHTMYTWVVYT